MKKIHLFLFTTLLLAGLASSRFAETSAADSTDDSARKFAMAHPGEEQFKFLSPHIVEAFPPGRSNAANDEALKKFPLITSDWSFEPKNNKFCVFEGDHFSIQWIFESKWKDNGTIQREGTLAFGTVKDGKLTSWTEFYDDSVGELQHDKKMNLYTADEEPYPWPAKPGYSRPYRAYDPNSVTWNNLPDMKRKLP
jgi:hypothetical protein